ncbi:MAG: CocE/NonD family hydrolase [Promethearchaeota archaeon]
MLDIFNYFLFSLEDAVQTNLLYTVAGRVIFIIFYLMNYVTLTNGKEGGLEGSRDVARMNVNDWSWFVVKEAVFIGIGFIHIAFAAAVLVYSFMNAGTCVVAASKRSHLKGNVVFGKILGTSIKYVLPLLAFGATAYMTATETDKNAPDYFYGASLAILLYLARSVVSLVQGRKRDLKPVERGMLSFKRELRRSLPRYAKVALLAGFCTSPILIFSTLDYSMGISFKTVQVYNAGDDVYLSTDVYRMRSATIPQPVILIRTPYNKDSMDDVAVSLIADGYVVVVQDMRGRYESGGEFIPFLNSYKDGVATIEWILNQSWCNGNIASWGGSALAINQYYYADEPTGGLKFQTINSGTPEFYDTLIYQGGAFRKSLIESWLYALRYTNNPKRPLEYNHSLDWMMTNPLKNASWNATSLLMDNRISNVNVSAIHICGWYDIMSQGTLDGYMQYNTSGGPGARGKQRLIMGFNGHGRFGTAKPYFNNADWLDFPAADESGHARWEEEMRAAAINGESINWSGPSVAYYLMGDLDNPAAGGNEWHYADDWPVPHSNITYFLQGNHSLGEINAGTNQNHSFLYDPGNPVPTRGGNNLMEITSLESDALGTKVPDPVTGDTRVLNVLGIGPYDQEAAGNLGRGDVLVYRSNALTTPRDIVGRITANLWVASNCTDTAFTVMLMDEYPDGRSFNILDGILVMRAREGNDHEAPALVDGNAYEITVDLWSTAYQFNTGHRIKIAISSSNYPRFERHPNNSDPLSNHPSNLNIANNSILTGGVYNSCIILPELL